MTFDDSEDVLNLNTTNDDHVEQESPVESDNPLSTFSEPTPADDELDQISPVTSNESADEEVKSVIAPAEKEQSVASPTKSNPPNGLAIGYTQAQLDEVKAFNAGLTKGW